MSTIEEKLNRIIYLYKKREKLNKEIENQIIKFDFLSQRRNELQKSLFLTQRIVFYVPMLILLCSSLALSYPILGGILTFGAAFFVRNFHIDEKITHKLAKKMHREYERLNLEYNNQVETIQKRRIQLADSRIKENAIFTSIISYYKRINQWKEQQFRDKMEQTYQEQRQLNEQMWEEFLKTHQLTTEELVPFEQIDKERKQSVQKRIGKMRVPKETEKQ